ncbi:uncharacterized protein B0H18DRAFT_953241 [Fomitopsis serialis]|uniref:uncharacterized protein n=1 Tax=Fomitopsis serialis TaxID=139415 RepID=UPI002007FA1B|nr:uncharacterized protein B0H18DRAFT_953241 [Neoantrodia serialis]KAH9930340.1 hypothetical protein B0H18DRAFT_953241 [Neoantrodia serialis]
MGRPLFSNHQQTPAVRVEPEQPQPTAKNGHSDEFFERSDAVYEAFMPQDGTALPQPPPLIEVPPSSSSSEASSSGRGSPTEEARRDLSSEEIDLALRREADLIRLSATREDEIQRRVREARETFTDTRSPGPTVPTDTDPQRVLRYVQGLDSISRQSQEATQIIRGLLPSADPAERAAARRFEEYMAHRNEPIDAQPRRADSSAPSARTRSRPNVRHVPDRGYNHFPDAPRVDLSSWIVS